MNEHQAAGAISAETIQSGLTGILKEMTADWDLFYSGDIGADTKLIEELGFESIDIVQLVVAIQEHFKRRDFPFEELLMADGRYVDEITVRDTVSFLHGHLNSH
ncbi:MAG: acyl carrier protein [Nitrospirae bacterium]|nr:acyl carrier protein [Nitrospirota bacterium]